MLHGGVAGDEHVRAERPRRTGVKRSAWSPESGVRTNAAARPEGSGSIPTRREPGTTRTVSAAAIRAARAGWGPEAISTKSPFEVSSNLVARSWLTRAESVPGRVKPETRSPPRPSAPAAPAASAATHTTTTSRGRAMQRSVSA